MRLFDLLANLQIAAIRNLGYILDCTVCSVLLEVVKLFGKVPYHLRLVRCV